MPNLGGVSPVGRGGEGHSYEAQTVGNSESGGRRHGKRSQGGLMLERTNLELTTRGRGLVSPAGDGPRVRETKCTARRGGRRMVVSRFRLSVSVRLGG